MMPSQNFFACAMFTKLLLIEKCAIFKKAAQVFGQHKKKG
jgi:hypothetical protein